MDTLRLSNRQRELLGRLPRYGKIREGTGRIYRALEIGGDKFSPSTFNSLVDRGLAFAVDHHSGRIYAGRLVELDAKPL